MTRAVQTLPYGEWPSPMSASDVAAQEVTVTFVAAAGDEVWWDETRPGEDGRTTVVRRRADGSTVDALPLPWHARTRVHEYGGRAWLPLPDAAGDAPSLLFAHWDDQRLYVFETVAEHARPLSPVPDEPLSLRYADPVLSADGREIVCVREAHVEGRVTRRIVAVPLDGSAAEDATAVREVAGDSDFLAHPRVSPDGSRIAWVAWDHPRMPWDGTELRLAELESGVAFGVRTVLGGPEESVLQPEWADAETLYAVSDRSGWWNLYRLDVGAPTGATLPPLDQAAEAEQAQSDLPEPQAMCPRAEEFAFPMWLLGYVSYAVLPGGRVAVLHGVGTYRLGVLDVGTGTLRDVADSFVGWQPTLAVVGHESVIGVAGSPTQPRSVAAVDLGSGTVDVVRAPATRRALVDYLPEPNIEALPGPGGRTVHARVYPPRNPSVSPPRDDRPPYVVFVHGGPTGQALALPSLEIAYFTSRGIGVVDVDYGGSSGYGREYRELLRGQWGVVDVEDCVAAARALVDRGDADGTRIAIRGGSAGGWTALVGVARTDFFAAGVSYFGVSDLMPLVEETHDFESRYLDSLVGALPAAQEVYVERSPLTHADDISCPVLLLQCAEDPVVPPSQSLLIRDALSRNNIPHAYLEFAGEQHGFRQQASIVRSLEAELSFYGQVFGFDPPGVPRLQLTAR